MCAARDCSAGRNWWRIAQTKEPVDEKLVQAVVADCMAQGVIIGMTNRSLPGYNNALCLVARADRQAR